jgi:hypothetical protein
MSMIHTASGWTVLVPGFIVTGFGIGMVNPVLASAAVSVVPPEHSGMASGSNNTFRQVGIATGIAGLGAVFQSQIQHATAAALGPVGRARELLAKGGAALKGALAGGGVRQAAAAIPSASARAALLHAYRVGFASTLDHLMIIGTVVAAIGSICAFVARSPARLRSELFPLPSCRTSNQRWPCDASLDPGRPSPGRRDDRVTNGPPGPSPRRPATAGRARLCPGVDGEHRQRGRRGPRHGVPALPGQG